MSKFLTVFFVLFLSVTIVAQEVDSKNHRKRMHVLSKEQINQLNEGVLLVRLQTKKSSVEALRKLGRNKLADKIEKKEKELNVKIVSAFKNEFLFCPTYFFFSNYSENVREEHFDKVAFVNDSLDADTSIKPDFKYFFIAEFTTVAQDTSKYFSNYTYKPDGSWTLERVANYNGSPNMGISALVIKSNQFIQLSKPFPYYVRTFDSFPIRRNPKKVVKKMNRKLIKFHQKKYFEKTR